MDQPEWGYGARMSRDRRAAEAWPTREPEINESASRWDSLADTGSMAPSEEALTWQRRADDWAQQAELEPYGGGQAIEPANRWSEVASTGRPTFPADGVGWRTQTSEWRATGARWRQTTEWRSSTGSHVWRSTTEAWRGDDEDNPESDKHAINGTSWPTPDADSGNSDIRDISDRSSTPSWRQSSTPSWQQSPAPSQQTPSWRQPEDETPSWRRSEEPGRATRPVEQTWSGNAPSWTQPSSQTPSWQQPADSWSTGTPPRPSRSAEPAGPSWGRGDSQPADAWGRGAEPPAPSWGGGAERSGPSWNGGAEQSRPSWNGGAEQSRPSWNGGVEPSASSWGRGAEQAALPSRPSWERGAEQPALPSRPSWERGAEQPADAWGPGTAARSNGRDRDPGENTTGMARWERTDAPGWQSSPAEDGRHLVREDDRAAWRRDADYPDPAPRRGRRRAPESEAPPAGGTGWSSGSDSDNWARHTDTGNIQMFSDTAPGSPGPQGPGWGARAEAPPPGGTAPGGRRSRREAPEPAQEQPRRDRPARYNQNATDWREDTSSWAAEPDTSNWTRDPDTGQWSRAEDDPRVLAWRAEAARRESAKESAPNTPEDGSGGAGGRSRRSRRDDGPAGASGGPNGVGPNGVGPSFMGSNGMGPDGSGSNGMGPNGGGPNGMGPVGGVPGGPLPSSGMPGGSWPTSAVPDGAAPPGPRNDAMMPAPRSAAPSSSAPRSAAPNSSAPSSTQTSIGVPSTRPRSAMPGAIRPGSAMPGGPSRSGAAPMPYDDDRRGGGDQGGRRFREEPDPYGYGTPEAPGAGGRRRAPDLPGRRADGPPEPPRRRDEPAARWDEPRDEPLGPEGWQPSEVSHQGRQYRRINVEPDDYPADGRRRGPLPPRQEPPASRGYGEARPMRELPSAEPPRWNGAGSARELPGGGPNRPEPVGPSWPEPRRDQPGNGSQWSDSGRPEPRGYGAQPSRELPGTGPSWSEPRTNGQGWQRELPAGGPSWQEPRRDPATGGPSWPEPRANGQSRQRELPAGGPGWPESRRDPASGPGWQEPGTNGQRSWPEPGANGPGWQEPRANGQSWQEPRRELPPGPTQRPDAGWSDPLSQPRRASAPAYGAEQQPDRDQRGYGDWNDPPTGGAGQGRPSGDWLAAERATRRGGAQYRETAGQAGETDWRQELSRDNSLVEGESRRYDTSDFPPFRPSGSAAVAGTANLALSSTSVITRPTTEAAPDLPDAPDRFDAAPDRLDAAPGRLDADQDRLDADPDMLAAVPGTARGMPGVAPEAEEDTSWPPRRPTGAFQGTGSYERRPVSGGLVAPRGTDLLDPDDDEEDEATSGGPLAAVGYTVVWYGVPVVLFVAGMFLLNSGQRTHALDTLADAAPEFGISLALSMLVALGLRFATTAWKSASVGLAAAVVGGGLATVLSSAITGNSLS